MKRPRFRPDNNLTLLTDEAWDLAYSMAESVKPRFTAEKIIKAVFDKCGVKINRNNVTTIWQIVDESQRTESNLAESRLLIAKNYAELVGQNEDGEQLLDAYLQGALMANNTNLRELPPDKIARLVCYQQRTQILREKVEADKERTAMQVKKMENDLAERDRQIADLRAGNGESPRDVFLSASKRVLDILKSYGDLRPLLQKFDSNISKRLAVESERFAMTSDTSDKPEAGQ
jgi:hypothetical protein